MVSERSRVSLGEITQDARKVASQSSRAAAPAKLARQAAVRLPDDDGCCKTCKGRNCVGRCRF
jgi:hypothetical protein